MPWTLRSTIKPFRFLDLPPEIRNKIYILLCTSPEPISLSKDLTYYIDEPIHPVYPHSLLLTNTQIYHEIRPVYFQCNTFLLDMHRHNERWPFLSPSFLDNRRHIHTLKLTVWRWGTKDFFCRELIPILEDCVLNGRLRDIEVTVKVGFARGFGKRERAGEEFGNWERLSTLMRDPYLERVKLVEGLFTTRQDQHEDGTQKKRNDITELIWGDGNQSKI